MRDGANFTEIDKVMERQFGWPMGPAYLLDVVGIDTAHHAQAVMAEGFPTRMAKSGREAIDALYEAKNLARKMAAASISTPLIKKANRKSLQR